MVHVTGGNSGGGRRNDGNSRRASGGGGGGRGRQTIVVKKYSAAAEEEVADVEEEEYDGRMVRLANVFFYLLLFSPHSSGFQWNCIPEHVASCAPEHRCGSVLSPHPKP